MSIEVRRAADRFHTEIDGRSTEHSFSFGPHYDPGNLGFGALIAHNDETLTVGSGYEPHLHRDTEIVTWVVSGALRHSDDLGHSAVIEPGQVQVLSAGSGVTHAETNAAKGPTRFIQAWLRPLADGSEPRYSVTDAPDQLGWTSLAVISGSELLRGVLTEPTNLPEAHLLHVFVLEGALGVGEREIRPGSAARLTDEGGREVVPGPDGATVLVWAMS